MNTPVPIPTMKFSKNGTDCSIISASIPPLMFFIRSRTKNGRITVNGVLNMLSSFNNVSALDLPPSSSTSSGDVPVISAANNKLLQIGICNM